jgi:uncharacterized membrane protein YkvA (DUF1232 family)
MKALDHALGHASKSAVSLLKDRNNTLRLIDAVIRRMKGREQFFDSKGLSVKMKAATRLVKLTVRREYRDVPWKSIVLITAGLIYFVSPADAIPDIIPLLGFTDDAAILAAILSSVSSDLDSFLEWEKSHEEDAGEK